MNKKIVGTIGTISITVVIAIVCKLLNNREISKFSPEWFKSLSDEKLKSEREDVRQRYCSVGNNFSLAVMFEKLLNMFDAEISKRAWNGEDYEFPKHREHGWHLSSDDD